MRSKTPLTVVGADKTDGYKVILYFSDGTYAFFTAEELIALAGDRAAKATEKPN